MTNKMSKLKRYQFTCNLDCDSLDELAEQFGKIMVELNNERAPITNEIVENVFGDSWELEVIEKQNG